jgi:N-acyl-D-amino-acid deacylase
MGHSFDVVLRGGTVVDGSGAAVFEADVAIKGGRIAEVGVVAGRGAQEFDVRGKLVTPGFVDLHTHYDGQVTWEHRLAPSSNHGVTTVVMGNCGVGFAPCRPGQQQLAIKLMEGVEDVPEAVMAEGLPWNWETFPEYLDALDRRRADVDFAAQLPHSPLRVYVMGERGAEREPPTATELAEMRRLTAEAVRAGAIGVSTSRQLAHRFRDGRSAPSVLTEEDEVTALAQGLRDAGTGVFQIICNTAKPAMEEFGVMRRLAETCGRPLSFTLASGTPTGRDEIMQGVGEARAEGLPMRAQFFLRPVGILFGLDLSYHPFSLNPSYRRLEGLPLADKVAALRDPDLRARLLAERPDDPNPFVLSMVRRIDRLFQLGDPPDYQPSPDESLTAKAHAQGRDLREVIYDALLDEDGRAILYCPLGPLGENPRTLFENEGAVLGLGDGGAHYGMICDAAYPTYLLTRLGRDAPRDERIDLPQAIKALTRDPAETVGFLDRGLVRPGLKADLNVIDYDALRLHPPRVDRDLPAGGKRLSQKADGYVMTLVSGEVTYRDGVHTGVLPGRLIRGQRPAAA